jgi:RNA-binding protein 5/10
MLSLCTTSHLEQKNLQDPALREEGHRKAQQAQLKGPPKPPGDGLPPPKYRDRALERRTAFRQPDMPQISGGEVSLKRKYSRGPTPPPPPPPPAIIPAKDEENVGNKLLKKMGWSEGSGLGAGGEGRVEPM